MLTEQELKSAVFAVEHQLKDIDRARERDKHNASALHETSQKVLELKIKLQVLYYAEGIVSMITKEELSRLLHDVSEQISALASPRELSLFGENPAKKVETELAAAKIKLFTLRYIDGQERTLI